MRTRKNAWVMWAVALVSTGIFASGAKAIPYDAFWDFDKLPNDASYGSQPMQLVGNGFGDGSGLGIDATAVQPGRPGGATGTIGDFADAGATGNNEWLYGNGSAGGLNFGYSIDMRVKAVAAPNNSGYSMNIRASDGSNAGIKLIPLGGNSIQVFSQSGGGVFVNVPNDSSNLSTYHMIRLQITGSSWNVFDLEDSAHDGANGTVAHPWDLLGSLPAGASGNDPRNGLIGTQGAFGLGALSNGTTTAGETKWDWVGVSYGSTLGGHDPIGDQGVPEPATLALLVLGCVPMMNRRRRS